MIFTLWSSPNQIPINYRGPIKKTSHLRPTTYLDAKPLWITNPWVLWLLSMKEPWRKATLGLGRTNERTPRAHAHIHSRLELSGGRWEVSGIEEPFSAEKWQVGGGPSAGFMNDHITFLRRCGVPFIKPPFKIWWPSDMHLSRPHKEKHTTLKLGLGGEFSLIMISY